MQKTYRTGSGCLVEFDDEAIYIVEVYKWIPYQDVTQGIYSGWKKSLEEIKESIKTFAGDELWYVLERESRNHVMSGQGMNIFFEWEVGFPFGKQPDATHYPEGKPLF